METLTDKARFGAFVAEERKRLGLTQKELAQRLYLSDKAVSKWERGLSLPDVSLLIPLAETLGVTVTELLEGRRIRPREGMEMGEVERLVKGALSFPVVRRIVSPLLLLAAMDFCLELWLFSRCCGRGGPYLWFVLPVRLLFLAAGFWLPGAAADGEKGGRLPHLLLAGTMALVLALPLLAVSWPELAAAEMLRTALEGIIACLMAAGVFSALAGGRKDDLALAAHRMTVFSAVLVALYYQQRLASSLQEALIRMIGGPLLAYLFPVALTVLAVGLRRRFRRRSKEVAG